MFYLSIVASALAIFTNSYVAISALMKVYGYFALFGLMLLESSSIPIPSEVVLPLAGALAASGVFNFEIAFLVTILASLVGLTIDYAIGYYIGKDVVYKHLQVFHVKKESLDNFDRWFERNGVAAVFLSRLLPVLRTVMSFPAGFAKMPLKKFYGYSLAGVFIWDLVLMLFGYYLIKVNSAVVTLTAIGVFGVVLYLIYAYAVRKLRRKG
ncbi:MAG TPA: DedA family protein [Candidatus Baltobacteraceae bacterium]|nr:DedA family protein [Candidatus Baltobacteraceae bacterium]